MDDDFGNASFAYATAQKQTKGTNQAGLEEGKGELLRNDQSHRGTSKHGIYPVRGYLREEGRSRSGRRNANMADRKFVKRGERPDRMILILRLGKHTTTKKGKL